MSREGWLLAACAVVFAVAAALFVSSCSASQRAAESAAIAGAEVRFVAALDKFCKLEQAQPVSAALTAIACGVDWSAHVVIPTSDWQACPMVLADAGAE